MENFDVKVIAHIETDFPTKFGIPRQSGLVPALRGRIVFVPEYKNPDALKGMGGFSHLWLIWVFSAAQRDSWSPTVRPPRLGGNTRMGVFATRSPFRPNSIGLSCVKIEEISPDGAFIDVSGVDLMNGTPILDIKPYVPISDCRPEALGGFSGERAGYALEVDAPDEVLTALPAEKRQALRAVLAQDPRPAYQNDFGRIYGFAFAGTEVKFRVDGSVLRVISVEKASDA